MTINKTEDQIRFENGQIPFWNRETYLEWRANWRAKYKATSEAIRQTKKDIREAYRNGQTNKASAAQRQLHFLRAGAHAQMKQRESANKLRDRQRAAYMAARSLEAV